jgi:hypothetical protein
MTQPPAPAPPPFGDATDEALSAFLDGELSAFASEHGTTAADARDRLEQWPGFAARVAELEQARAALRAPVPPLDELTRRRLVRSALPAAPGAAPGGRRSGRSWLTIAAAAMAVVVVVGLGAALVTRSGDGGETRASKSAGTAPEARRGDLGDVGDVTDPATLRALLDPAGAAGANRRDAGGKLGDGGSTADGSAPAAASTDPSACAARLAGSRPVRFVARATFRGRPVVVVGITQGARTIAFVVPADDCTTVLTSVSR